MQQYTTAILYVPDIAMPVFRWLPLRSFGFSPGVIPLPGPIGPLRLAANRVLSSHYSLLIHRHLSVLPVQALLPTSEISQSPDILSQVFKQFLMCALYRRSVHHPDTRIWSACRIVLIRCATMITVLSCNAFWQVLFAVLHPSSDPVQKSCRQTQKSSDALQLLWRWQDAVSVRRTHCFHPVRSALSYFSVFSLNKICLPARSLPPPHICSSLASSLPKSQVGCDGTGEQHSFLRYKANLLTQICHGKLPDIGAIQRNASALSHHTDAESGSPALTYRSRYFR